MEYSDLLHYPLLRLPPKNSRYQGPKIEENAVLRWACKFCSLVLRRSPARLPLLRSRLLHHLLNLTFGCTNRKKKKD